MLSEQVLLALQQITDLSRKYPTESEFLKSVVKMLGETTGFSYVALEQYNPTTQEIIVAASTDPLPLEIDRFSLRRPDPKLALSEAVLSSKQTSVKNFDASMGGTANVKFPFHPETSNGIQTLVKVPMIVNQYVVGVLDFAHIDVVDDPTQLSFWAQSLASYVGSLLLNQQFDSRRDSYVQRLELLGNATQGFSYDWDLASGDVERLPEMSDVFDLPFSSAMNRLDSWLDHVHSDDRNRVSEFFEVVWRQQNEFSISYRICDAVDQIHNVTDSGRVIRDMENQPMRVVGRVVLANPSIAAVPVVEVELPTPKPVEPVSEPAQHSHTLLEQIKTVIFKTDLDGRWVYLNPAWTALTGYEIRESLGESFIDLVALDDRQGILDSFQGLLDGQTDCYSQEVRMITKSGAERWLAMEIQAKLSDDGNLTGAFGSFHDVSSYKNTEAQLLQNALYDSLTGLPNRVLFLERLRHTYRAYRRNHDNLFTVLFLDMDSFKEINDTYGHLVGDQVLVEVAKRVVACLRPGDTTARLGGDEFTILLPQINARDDVADIANRILASLRAPYDLGEYHIETSATIGIAVSGHPYEQPEDLLRNADMALYQAKTAGKSRYVIYKPNMNGAANASSKMESDLRQAIESQAFRIDYQPVFDLKTESLVGFNALMRWNHPKEGEIDVNNFIEVAETSGLSIPMGWQLLEQACEQLSLWHAQYSSAHMTMAVPLSMTQLKSSELISKLRSILEMTSLPPASLKLELPGGVDVLESGALRSQIEDLHRLGVIITLSGISSLEPGASILSFGGTLIHELKLDPSLVTHMAEENNLESLRFVLAMGHKFKFSILADGIESAQKLAQLRSFRCERGQGEYFAGPMSVDHIEARWIEFSTPQDELSSSLQSPALVMNSDTQQSQFSLFGRQAWSIGRSTESAIVLPDRWVSRHHAELQCMSNGDVYFVDLGSGNGSFVNGTRVSTPVLLEKGDRLTVGQTDLDFVAATNHISQEEMDLSGLTVPKTVLMMQSSKIQGEVWREALTSQGISLIWLQPSVDLVQLLEQRTKTGQPLPDLLLLDMTVIKPNSYSFCRWCMQEYKDLDIILTSGGRSHVPPSERQWAINQGAKDLLSAFPEQNIFGNMVDVVSKVRIVLSALEIEPSDQSSLSEVLISLKKSMNRATLH